MTSSAFIIATVRWIRVARQWVWWTWVWIRVLWYVISSYFLFTFWRVHWWCFWVWHFCTNRSRIQMCSNHFNIFALALKFRIFVPNFKISFIVCLYLVYHWVSNRYFLSYSILRCASMGDIRRPYYPGSGAPDPAVFIQHFNGRDSKEMSKTMYFSPSLISLCF